MQLDADALAEMLAPIIADEVAKATGPLLARIADLEARKPEAGPRGEKGEPGERGEKGDAGTDGSNGRDGAGIVDGFINRDGHLIATLSDGTTRDFGEIVGKDGRDGEAGKDGRDGFGFDDMDVNVLDDDRTIELSFRRGDEVKAFTLKWPTMIYRGVYSQGKEYEAGDAVTWGGHVWIAERSTSAKPDQPGEGWRLAVKRGARGPAALTTEPVKL
jgi:integrin beta 3